MKIANKCKTCPHGGQEGYIGVHPNCQYCQKGEIEHSKKSEPKAQEDNEGLFDDYVVTA